MFLSLKAAGNLTEAMTRAACNELSADEALRRELKEGAKTTSEISGPSPV